MATWLRVFGTACHCPEPAALLQELAAHGFEASGHFQGDEVGWFRAMIAFVGGATMQVDRYEPAEDNIRGQLNGWAAWLETLEETPFREPLMTTVVQALQVFTIQVPNVGTPASAQALRSGHCLARILARRTQGVFQQDGVGFCDAEGCLLIAEA